MHLLNTLGRLCLSALMAAALMSSAAACGQFGFSISKRAGDAPAPMPTDTPTSAIPTSTPTPQVTSASATIRHDNPLIAEVAVSLDAPGRVFVEYWNPDAGRYRTAETRSEDMEHVVPILRLRPETEYSFQAFAARADGGASEGLGGEFTTGALPDALGRMSLAQQGRPTSELVLMDYEDNPESFYVALDQDAQVVWYYAHQMTAPEEFTSARTVRQKPDFNLVFLEGGPLGRRFNCCMKEITPLGELVDRLVNNEIDKWVNRDIQVLGQRHCALPSERDSGDRRHRARGRA